MLPVTYAPTMDNIEILIIISEYLFSFLQCSCSRLCVIEYFVTMEILLISSVLFWMNCFSPLQKVPLKATLTFLFSSTLVLEFYLPEYFCFISDNENMLVPNVTIIHLFSRTAPADLSKIVPDTMGRTIGKRKVLEHLF